MTSKRTPMLRIFEKLCCGTPFSNIKSTMATSTIKNNDDTVLYHMCQKALWDDAVQSATAYYPPTFQQDGYFTHATAIPERLIATANHFYTKSDGDWICLALSERSLRNIGIVTKYEEPMAVGSTESNDKWKELEYKCPHIYGGIPHQIPGIFLKSYTMERDEKTGIFLGIPGLTN